MTKPKNKIIFPLDVSTGEDAERLLNAVGDRVGLMKIGFEIITALGVPLAITIVRTYGGEVFLDTKFHDIPNTVGKAVAAAARQGVHAVNIHASAGREAIQSAVANREKTRIWGVTVCTSIDDEACKEIYGAPTSDVVGDLALMLAEEGAQGVICSPKEIGLVKSIIGSSFPDFEIITPGVRPTWAPADDQKRVMTPGEAVKAGADWLVIGRPISNPPAEIGSPEKAIQLILQEMAEAQVATAN